MPAHFQFVHPAWLYVLPLLALIVLLRRRRGSDGSISYPTTRFIEALASPADSLAGRIGALLMVLSAASLIVALARPQLVNEREVRSVSGVDIIIAFDLSASMQETDMVIRGSISDRLNAAKYVITNFIKTRPDDRIGIVGFSGKTKSLCPLTLDHALVAERISQAAVGTIMEDGTAIGSAIAASASRLNDRKETKSKVIILVTDGASNRGKISPVEAAAAAAKLGIRIYTIAVGSDSRQSGRYQGDFDEVTLKKIASLTGGEHFRASDTDRLQLAFSSIDQLEKTEARVDTIRTERDYFMYLLAAALILAALGLAMQILRPNPAP